MLEKISFRKGLEKMFNMTSEEIDKVDEENACIVLINGKNKEGNDFYAYVAVPPSKLVDFKYAAKKVKKKLNIYDYDAEVIYYEEGVKEPPKEMQDKINQAFLLDPNFKEKAINSFEKFKEENRERIEKLINEAQPKQKTIDDVLVDKINKMKKNQGDNN